MKLLAIDPGPQQSALLLWDTDAKRVVQPWIGSNVQAIGDVRCAGFDVLALEMIASYGMSVGAEVFETCLWVGRYIEAADRAGRPYVLVYRREVKDVLCGSVRAKDANIRAALIDRFGGRQKAIGTKREPGPLYGIRSDLWAALGVAITWQALYAATTAA